MIAHEQDVEAGGELRAYQLGGRRDRLGLVGMVMQVSGVPAASGRVDERGDLHARLRRLSALDADCDLGLAREKAATGGHRKAVLPWGDRLAQASAVLERGEKGRAPEEPDDRLLAAQDRDTRIERGAAARVGDREVNAPGLLEVREAADLVAAGGHRHALRGAA